MTLETGTSHTVFRSQLDQAVHAEQRARSKSARDIHDSALAGVEIPGDIMGILTAIFTAKQAAIFLLNKSPSYRDTPLNLLKTGNEKQIAKIRAQLASIMNGYVA
jgi:hypothetical protein